MKIEIDGLYARWARETVNHEYFERLLATMRQALLEELAEAASDRDYDAVSVVTAKLGLLRGLRATLLAASIEHVVADDE